MTDYPADLLIINGLVLTMEDRSPPLADGFVAVKDGLVSGVGPMTEFPPGASAERTIDASGHLVMPGLINTHVHAAMSLFRGLADDLPLMIWLNEHMFPAEARFVNQDLVYWGAKLSIAEMLLSGTTGLADAYFHEDGAVQAALDTGIRAVLSQGVIDFPAPGVPDPTKNIETAKNFVERWQGVSPLIQPGVFCHSPYTCSPETLTRAKELAQDKGVLFQTHVSETAAEVEQILAERDMTPAAYLDSLGLLDERTLLVHGVHLTSEEIDLLVERKTPLSVCIESNMKLGSGLAPVLEMLAKGLSISLGTDGPASNNDLSLFGEIRSAALLYKVDRPRPHGLAGAPGPEIGRPPGGPGPGLER